jgi:4-amino-4-deoxy-L-arabinose transferase-like glycosyltransferase
MSTRQSLVLVAVVAALHGAFFAYYQAPDWAAVADQEGYRRLGRALAETGRFTRFPDTPEFVPEVIRTPGYPVFVAVVYKLFGTSQVVIAAAQTALFVAIALLVFVIARRCASIKVAIGAAALTALYPTFPYFGALVMTELWTTFVLTLAFAAAFRAHRTAGTADYLLTGFLFGCAALSRPAFVLLPFAIAGMGALIFWKSFRRVVQPWGWVIVVFMLTLLPWFVFNYEVMGRFALAPAGGVGRGLWEGSWHGRWPGRLHNRLTELAAEPVDLQTLDRRVQQLAADTGRDPAPMKTYVHQWREIRRIWDDPIDPHERAEARVRADREYQRVALENIRQDVAGHVWRRLTHGFFVLWNADIWLRYSEINAASPALIRAMWTVQVVLLLFAIWGSVTLARHGLVAELWLLITPLLYVTAVHLPLLTEARQSLPVKPLLLIAAAIGMADVRQRLFAFKPEIHERQHV